MSGPVRAIAVRRRHGGPADDAVTLSYEERLIRRKRVVTDRGAAVLVDLPTATGLDAGDALELEDGRLVAVRAAPEALISVTADPVTLTRLAWHVGNRHAPARIEAGRLLVRAEPVMAEMLRRLGATVAPVTMPFEPEGGAYGEGRTIGHSHGPGDGPSLGGLSHDPL